MICDRKKTITRAFVKLDTDRNFESFYFLRTRACLSLQLKYKFCNYELTNSGTLSVDHKNTAGSSLVEAQLLENSQLALMDERRG